MKIEDIVEEHGIPIMQKLLDEANPYTTVIITGEGIRITEDIFGIPANKNDCSREQP